MQTIKSSQFRAGQVIRFYGARYRLRDNLQVHHDGYRYSDGAGPPRPVFTITGDRVTGHDLGGFEMPATWDFQGNDLATWGLDDEFMARERADLYVEIAMENLFDDWNDWFTGFLAESIQAIEAVYG